MIGIGILNATQALLVLAPGAGIPAWLNRFKTKLWALIAPVSIALVVAAIALVPEVADGLTWFALHPIQARHRPPVTRRLATVAASATP